MATNDGGDAAHGLLARAEERGGATGLPDDAGRDWKATLRALADLEADAELWPGPTAYESPELADGEAPDDWLRRVAGS